MKRRTRETTNPPKNIDKGELDKAQGGLYYAKVYWEDPDYGKRTGG